MTEPGPGPGLARAGPYRLVRRLGTGGMGAVYLGHHESSGAPAAVKLIRPEHVADAEFRARLRREIDTARRVPRFCTAPVLDADPDADQPWVATEYIDAPTLDVVILEQGRLTGAGLEEFAVGVAVALRAIHEQGVVHRDLKPSNVLVSPVGPRVIDFGIARADDAGTHLTRTGQVIGTPAYMAPEQLRDEALTAAVDVFAWAGLVTYAGTGQPPFGADAAAMHAILHEWPRLGDLAEPVRTLVTAAFDKDPAHRPSAADLVDRLSHGAAAATTRVLDAAGTTPPTASGTHSGSVPTAPTAPPQSSRDTPYDPGPDPGADAEPVIASSVPPQDGQQSGPDAVEPRERGRRSTAAVVATATTLLLAAATALVVAVSSQSSGDGDAADGTAGSGPTGDGVTGSPTEEVADPNEFGARIHNLPLSSSPVNADLVVWSVATAEVDGTPVAVAGDANGHVHVWDLTTGDEMHLLAGHTFAERVESVATGEVDGTPVAVSGGLDETVRVWDLTTGEEIYTLTGHTEGVSTVAVSEFRDTPVAVSSGDDGTTRLWDLTTGEQIVQPTGYLSLRLFDVDGNPVGMSQDRRDGDVRVRFHDLPGADEQVGETLFGHTGATWAAALGEVDDTLVAVTGSLDSTARVWNLDTGEELHQFSHTRAVRATAIGELAGTPIAVSAGGATVRVWDLSTGEQVGDAFRHSASVDFEFGERDGVALGELDGIPVAVSGGNDGTVRVWSLANPPGLTG